LTRAALVTRDFGFASGITNFELQGSFGKFYWLGEFYTVLTLNVIFAVVTAFCLTSKVTAKVRTQLYKALREYDSLTLFRCFVWQSLFAAIKWL